MRTKKAIRNLLISILQELVSVFVNFIMTPLIVGTYGSTINGLVASIKQIMGYVQLTGAGISQSSTVAMYKPIANEDYETLNGIYSATNKLFNKAGYVFSAIVFCVAIVYPFTLDDVNYITAFALVLVMAISGASEFFVCGKYTAILTAKQDYHIIGIARIAGQLSNLIICILMIKLHVGIIIVELGLSALYVCRILIMYGYIHRNYKELTNMVGPRFDLIMERKDVIAQQIAGLVVSGSSTFLASMICGLKEASIYSVYALIFAAIHKMCGVISQALASSFGDVISRGNKEILRQAFSVYESLYLIVVTIVYTVSYLLAMPLIKIYTSGMTDANYYLPQLALLFIVVGISNNMRYPSLTLINAGGFFKKTRNAAIMEAIINLVAQIVLASFFGLYGLTLGCIVSYIFNSNYIIWFSNKHILGQSCKNTYKRIVINLVVASIVALWVKHLFVLNISECVSWCLYAFIFTIIVAIFVLTINMIVDKQVFRYLKKRMKMIITPPPQMR